MKLVEGALGQGVQASRLGSSSDGRHGRGKDNGGPYLSNEAVRAQNRFRGWGGATSQSFWYILSVNCKNSMQKKKSMQFMKLE